MDKIDELDRRILVQLQRDSDLPLDDVADRVGLSRNAVWRRIKALETKGIITGRVAILDAGQLSLGLTVYLSIRTTNHQPDWLDKFARAVAQMPEIQGAYRMSGELDYLVRVRVADVAGYDRFYQRLIRKIDMSDVSASFVMESLKDTTELPL